jgi:endonuclease-3
MKRNRARQILRTLQKAFPLAENQPNRKTSSFETLIITIISQNTNDKNTARAFSNLSKRFCITPETLANARTNQIKECLRVGGLYKSKANAIKEVSKEILEKHGGKIDSILALPLEQARDILMQLTRVGPKTADVVLLFSAKRPTIPIDTHVNRVSKRLQLVPPYADYENVRNKLQELFKTDEYLTTHILLIALGREYCKARKPLCSDCPVSSLCPSKLCEQNG